MKRRMDLERDGAAQAAAVDGSVAHGYLWFAVGGTRRRILARPARRKRTFGAFSSFD
jgi:hypothetical protein